MKALPDAVASRLQLGQQMRAHRERAQISRAQADALSTLHGGVYGATSLEIGVGTVCLHDLLELCDLYGIVDHAERTRLLDLARSANATVGWWEAFNDIIPPHSSPYLGWEQVAAETLWTFQPSAIPGLLHTDAYARAELQLAHPGLGEADLDYRHALALKRRERLHSGDLALVALVSETALTSFQGDRRILFRQLEHLQDLCDHPYLTLQIVPNAGFSRVFEPVGLAYLPRDTARPALTATSGPLLPDLVYLSKSTLYLDHPAGAEPYVRRLAAMATQTPAGQTPLLLKVISKGLLSPRGLVAALMVRR